MRGMMRRPRALVAAASQLARLVGTHLQHQPLPLAALTPAALSPPSTQLPFSSPDPTRPAADPTRPAPRPPSTTAPQPLPQRALASNAPSTARHHQGLFSRPDSTRPAPPPPPSTRAPQPPPQRAHASDAPSTARLPRLPWERPTLPPGGGGWQEALPVRGGERVDPFGMVADELAALANKMRQMVCTEIPKLATAAEYFFRIGTEGKRFRPTVLLLMATALTGVMPGLPGVTAGLTVMEAEHQDRDRQRRIAEITEMIHVASLLHDDVLDMADKRRGVGSLNFVMGNKLAVLAGDFLLARASMALASLHNTEVVQLLSQVLEHLVAGEIMQMSANASQACDLDYYMQKNFYKTASLIANSCKSIAVLAGQPPSVADLAFDYGRHLGLAYQLVDDALDFTGTTLALGKPALADISQGLATAPVLFAAEEFPGMLQLIHRKFGRSGDVEQAVGWVRESRGLERTQELAELHARSAAAAIAALPPPLSDAAVRSRLALVDLTRLVLERKK